ncbi:MAG: DUF4445 domain-containing protein [Oscillospiraceae bacterium]|nr:DUF4445 domain-containing protein [Oscillospiraceae bacterium]
MKRFSEKVYIEMTPPIEEDAMSAQKRISSALEEAGFTNVKMPVHILQKMYNICLDAHWKITLTLVYREEDWCAVEVEAGDTTDKHYALAVDYGSTNIVMQLLDMNEGKVLAQAREMNGQFEYGSDILTRITFTMADPANMEKLQRVTVETYHRLFDTLTKETGVDVRKCPVMILAGNTTMMHFLLKLDARTVFFSPFAPVTMDPGWIWGSDVGMDFGGMLYFIPSISNYIGGDITSGLITLDFYKNEKVGMFFDIGTNGELVMGNNQWILAGAGAAGPALEGYVSRFGMRAQDGTVDTVKIEDGVLKYTTIGNVKPIGICGSGIIDLLAQMRLNGWMNIAGELQPDASDSIIYHEEEEQYVVVYAAAEESGIGEMLYFSQNDIKMYLETKAAAFTMIDCLMQEGGCTEEDIDHCYLSGAFSAHSNLEHAITIGIFPDLPRERYSAIANTSLDGARTLLLNREKLADIRWLLETVYCVQFASIPDFLIRMYAAKFVPHTNMERFPIIAEKLKRG